jgi:ABC-type multidrug transport system fused ATPase/permease subunit
LSFDINSGQKIGIVGRTGAGKTSIGLTLSRIVELLSGSIKIDGLDIAKVPLKELRSRITVIPQEPTLFNCSLRFNLDPLNKYSDDELLRVLKKASLQKILKHEENGLYQEI